MTGTEIKTRNLDTLAEYQKQLCREPKLRQLFLELTLNCNEHCFHCGSSCSENRPDGLPLADYKKLLQEVKQNFGTDPLIAVTGGEPLLYPDFFPLMEYVRELGFAWGMTSNGTLITKEVAHHLKTAGMRSISLSIDGLPKTHDHYRGLAHGFELAMEGIQHLIDEDSFNIMVTTVVNHENIHELDEMFAFFDGIDINEWRLTGIEPIGRAEKVPQMLLTAEDNRRLMQFIKEKRKAGYPVEYSCCHFLGTEYEAEVRDWYFLCNAGVYVAGVLINGDVTACLDIPHNEKSIQGNIYDTPFTEIWKNRFEIFRRPLSERNAVCAACPQEKWCRGGSYHSWDYENEKPKVCMKGILFD
ncbi:MAG: radical SAM protein [Lachnospiraceae bacterium]|nr:radical SAM protein [Lachnospiraceae bacterium]